MVFAPLLSKGLLARFGAVILEDASAIQLPAQLADHWKGCGGSGSESSLTLAVRWDLRSGQLSGHFLQDGRGHETRNALHAHPLPPESLWIADAGYDRLTYLQGLQSQGIFFVTRPCGNLVVSSPSGQRLDLAAVLSSSLHRVIDLPVRLGSLARLWLAARLIALPVDEQIAQSI